MYVTGYYNPAKDTQYLNKKTSQYSVQTKVEFSANINITTE